MKDWINNTLCEGALPMQIRKVQHDDLDTWVELRHSLWPNHEISDIATEARAIIESQDEVCFVVSDDASRIVGFLEGAIYSGPNGPYGHVEGWYIKPEFRKLGYGKELMGQFEGWCLHRAICLLTSDTEASYPISPAAHNGCGFRQIHELKIFLKELQLPGGA